MYVRECVCQVGQLRMDEQFSRCRCYHRSCCHPEPKALRFMCVFPLRCTVILTHMGSLAFINPGRFQVKSSCLKSSIAMPLSFVFLLLLFRAFVFFSLRVPSVYTESITIA